MSTTKQAVVVVELNVEAWGPRVESLDLEELVSNGLDDSTFQKVPLCAREDGTEVFVLSAKPHRHPVSTTNKRALADALVSWAEGESKSQGGGETALLLLAAAHELLDRKPDAALARVLAETREFWGFEPGCEEEFGCDFRTE